MKYNNLTKYSYYFFNFLIVFIVLFIICWFSIQRIYWQCGLQKTASIVLPEKKVQDLTPDFILSQVKEDEPSFSLLAVGDIMLSRVVGQKMLKHGYGYPFSKMADITKDADLSFANLETAVLPGRVVHTGEMMFRSDPESVQSMAEAGFDLVSLANNHTPNYGQNGLKKTFVYLEQSGLDYMGAGQDLTSAYQAFVTEVNGIKLAFLAYNDSDVVPDSYEAGQSWAGTAIMDIDQIKSDIGKVRKQVDLVIVSMHSGTEYIYTANKRQTEFAHAAIDNGADLVIGHHPHVVQEMEIYKDKYIFYSLGNYIFDQMWSEETRQGVVLKLELSKSGVEQFIFIPVVIEDFAQPRLAGPTESAIIMPRLNHELEKKQVLIFNDKEYKIIQREGLFGESVEERRYFKLNTNSDQESELIYHDKKNERVYVFGGEEIIWSSDPDWQVKKVVIGDVNFDGKSDVVMNVWKRGNYGESQPFWAKENDMSLGNHLFVYSFFEDGFRPLWQSSTIPRPNIDILVHDINNDQVDELVVLEDGDNNLDQAEHIAVWQWDDWGFSNVWRSEVGVFVGLGEVLGEIVFN